VYVGRPADQILRDTVVLRATATAHLLFCTRHIATKMTHLIIITLLIILVAYGHMNLSATRKCAMRMGVPAAELACPRLISYWHQTSDGMVPAEPDPVVETRVPASQLLNHAQRWEQQRMKDYSAQRKMAVEQVKGGL
jgi:hypothetical protein